MTIIIDVVKDEEKKNERGHLVSDDLFCCCCFCLVWLIIINGVHRVADRFLHAQFTFEYVRKYRRSWLQSRLNQQMRMRYSLRKGKWYFRASRTLRKTVWKYNFQSWLQEHRSAVLQVAFSLIQHYNLTVSVGRRQFTAVKSLIEKTLFAKWEWLNSRFSHTRYGVPLIWV